MVRCLVTGDKGYIGSRLSRSLKESGHEVRGIDIKPPHGLPPMDVKKDLHYFKRFKPEYIFHLAALPQIQYSIENPSETMLNNVYGTSKVLEFAHAVGCKRVIFSSSAAIYGNKNGPESPYAAQKLMSEVECQMYSSLYELDTVSLRYFNVYSPEQPRINAYATVIPSWMECVRNATDPFITGTGEQSRDMVHLDDIVSVNIFAMKYEERFNGKYFDVGTGHSTSLNEIKDIVLRHHPDLTFTYVSQREGEVFCSKADTFPLGSIGWNSSVKAERGIEYCFLEGDKR